LPKLHRRDWHDMEASRVRVSPWHLPELWWQHSPAGGACSRAQVREYIGQLEVHLAEAHKQAARLVKRQDSLSSALANFGNSMVGPPTHLAALHQLLVLEYRGS
jgi:hypothetical protein